MVDDVSDGAFSLADLADLDVSDISEIRFEVLPAGVYEWEVTDADLLEDTDKDGAKRFRAEVTLQIIGVKAVLEAGVDKESLVGKKHTEKQYINPGKPQDEVAKQIGRVRAMVSDMGMDSTGKLGDIVRNLKGHRFDSKLVNQKDKTDPSVVYARLKLEAKK